MQDPKVVIALDFDVKKEALDFVCLLYTSDAADE